MSQVDESKQFLTQMILDTLPLLKERMTDWLVRWEDTSNTEHLAKARECLAQYNKAKALLRKDGVL